MNNEFEQEVALVVRMAEEEGFEPNLAYLARASESPEVAAIQYCREFIDYLVSLKHENEESLREIYGF